MRTPAILRRTDGATALEFALTAPVFFSMIIGMITMGIGLYAQTALQHGVEMAARCASINTTLCGSTTAIKNYAVQQSLGLSPSASTFTVTTPSCGYNVQASYPVTFDLAMFGYQTVTLAASSCYPK